MQIHTNIYAWSQIIVSMLLRTKIIGVREKSLKLKLKFNDVKFELNIAIEHQYYCMVLFFLIKIYIP